MDAGRRETGGLGRGRSRMTLPPRVRIVEVGPRDGLQNEAALLSVDAKVAFIEMLARAGLISIEAGSFVSPKAAPQMASTGEVLEKLRGRADLRLSVLVANPRGLEAAFKAGAKEIAVFAAASETFSRHNINCSIAESLARFKVMVEEAARRGIWARGYVSCALGCPYEGAVAPARVAAVARELRAIGCAEVSLGDTIGVGTPLEARRLVEMVAREIGLERVAVHFHDTYGQALANIFACLEAGVAVVDSSVGGSWRLSLCSGRQRQCRHGRRDLHVERPGRRNRGRTRRFASSGRVYFAASQSRPRQRCRAGLRGQAAPAINAALVMTRPRPRFPEWRKRVRRCFRRLD